ncbi:MAG: hypothetical protein K9L26_00960 [Candidatus Izimaplasma sp.]|nr:hypothetical protein [Candidatus Izimaplasma bacterium]
MDKEPNHDDESKSTKDKEENKEPNDTSSEDKPSKENLEEDLKRIMDELKKQEKTNKKGPKKQILAIEFGGVYHTNQIVNFMFSYLLNMTLIFLVIEVFGFAVYDSMTTLLFVGLTFSAVEALFRMYIFSHHFKLILRTFGTIFYFGYVLIFYIIDDYLFIESFRFINETLLVFFVLIFAVLRYSIGVLIKRYLRQGLRR